MPCIVSENRITCFRFNAPGSIRVKLIKTGEEFWCDLKKHEYDARPGGVGVTLCSEGSKPRRFLKSHTEYVCDKDEWLERKVAEIE